MTQLLKKELVLSMHPTVWIFMGLSAFLLIPNYPYYITFFYTGLAIFFTCLSGRENNDVFYTMTLPVSKKSIVQARFEAVILVEMLQMLTAVLFTVVRYALGMPGNDAGMDANIAFFGFSFVLLGLFNLVFFTAYYKNLDKVGRSFMYASTVMFLYIAVAETLVFINPFVHNVLDTPDPQNLTAKLFVLAIGIALYIGLTFLGYKESVKRFEKQDV